MSGVWESDFMAPFLFLLFMMVAQVGGDANGKDFSYVMLISTMHRAKECAL